MQGYKYKPAVEKKPVHWGWIAVTSVISALIGTGYNVGRVVNGTLIHAPANASAFEAGRSSPYAALLGGGMGAAIVIWAVFWLGCRFNHRTTGWRSFAIIAAAAMIPSVILFTIAGAMASPR